MAGGPPRRRVVITGLGAVTPLGTDVDSTWAAACEPRSGVTKLAIEGIDAIAVRIGACIPELPEAAEIGPKDRKRLDRSALLALLASLEAVRDAGIERVPESGGCYIGSGIGGLGTMIASHRQLLAGHRPSPFMVPMSLAGTPAAVVAIRHGLRGPTLCHTTACASGAHAIGEAWREIAEGRVDWMIAGGTESVILPLVLAGFASMHALSTRNDEPARACRPFDRARDGFVMGEGAGLLVLESAEHAAARGARVRAELLGYAATGDAHHVAAPPEDGHGAERCMREALASAALEPDAVGYVNAHGTGTPAGDRIEADAIRRVFGEHGPAVSSTKGTMGHLLGAAGGVEALLCVRALETETLPPTLNLDDPDPDCHLDHVAGKPRRARIGVAASNSFGFGGYNATLVFGRAPETA